MLSIVNTPPPSLLRFSVTVALLLFFATQLHSRTNASALCDSAAQVAAAHSNVPVQVLQAITLTETGRTHDGTLQPWPWTVNMEGVGRWFSSRDEAFEYVMAHLRKGSRSFDIGCFQINYKWHGHTFDSIEAMFDPRTNAQYAAEFLSRLYKELGSWPDAVGAYHSRTERHAQNYLTKFNTILADLSSRARSQPSLFDQNIGNNQFPLLQNTGATRSVGSLVPLENSSGGNLLMAMRGRN